MSKAELPDFDDFLDLAQQIRDLMMSAEVLENYIKEKESKLHQKYMTDPSLFYNGKPISSTAINSAYEFCGFNDELLEVRNQYSKTKADLEHAKLKMSIYKMQVEMYRTDAASKRAGVL